MESSKRDCCKSDCDDVMRQRMNYFTGRHLTARDFSDEQAYHRTHRYFHNRILHGWGVVCGLEVREHKQADCRDKYVYVSPGMAIDCCGREILVDCAICCGQEQPEIPWDEYRQSHPWLLLCLCYSETGVEPVPVLSGEGDCSTAESSSKYGRFKEGWELCWRWIAKADLEKYSWKPPYGNCPPEPDPVTGSTQAAPQSQVGATQSPAQYQQGSPTGQTGPPAPDPHPQHHHHPGHPQMPPAPECPHDDCGDPCDEGFRSCIAPRCPPKHCVPLALICVKPGQPVLNSQILMRGRPELPLGPQRLTHIVGINWPHGGLITPRWLEHHQSLIITFDRKLQEPPPREYAGPWGVNAATFVVQSGGSSEDLDFVISEGAPSLIADGTKAEFKVDLRNKEYKRLTGHMLWITLRCDFLFDCHGLRVDGNNDGIAGGTFESWVSVITHDEYELLKREGRS